jgi:class 3 adenylate cyclase
MSDSKVSFDILASSVRGEVARAIEAEVLGGEDSALVRINPLAFASKHGFAEDDAIAGFVHASALGLFDLSWNILCPGCGGVLDANASLRTVVRDEYVCSLCAADYETTLDGLVEVTFTVNPRVRRIAAHNPETLSPKDFLRQLYWGSGLRIDYDRLDRTMDDVIIDTLELGPGEKGVMSMTLPPEFVIVFEPVTHSAQFIDVTGEPTREKQTLTLSYDHDHMHNRKLEMRPGTLRLSLENRTSQRVLPMAFIAGQALHDFLHARQPYLTATRLLSNQTFRDLYRTQTLDVDQRLRITSLTFLFTDLRGSTELYERVGDLAAFDLVRTHFRLLNQIVAAESGAVVKTIGDAVMATFTRPDRALAAALKMRDAMRGLNESAGRDDLLLKIGLHEGPCIAVSLNDRQDYFGQTVNIASRVQGLADSRAIYVTAPVVDDAAARRLLEEMHLTPVPQDVSLRGVEREIKVFSVT